jgi:PAS domain S-box-containing protein
VWAHLAAVVYHTDDAVIAQALDGTICEWSPGAEQLLGHLAAEAVGRPIGFIVPAALRPAAKDLFDRVRRGALVVGHETTWVTRTGEPVEVALTMAPAHRGDGTVVAVSTIARILARPPRPPDRPDTDTHTDTARLAASWRDIHAAQERYRTFVADAAHQLRRPVAGIQACAETLLLGVSPADRDRLLADMVRETGRAAELITALLKMARLDAGEVLAPSPCDVAALCADEADRLWSLAPHLDIVFRASSMPAAPPELDAGAVREILANLLDNARRHAISRLELTVKSEQPGWVAIRLTDDGPGMAPELAERAFQRFESLDDKGGTGLGLPIARALAEAHGGTLTYERSTFVLRLPMRAHRPYGSP